MILQIVASIAGGFGFLYLVAMSIKKRDMLYLCGGLYALSSMIYALALLND